MPFLILFGIVFGIILVVVLFVRVVNAFASKCPKCGKLSAMVEVSRRKDGWEYTTVDVEREVKDRNNNVTHKYKEAVPATRYFYICRDKCKYCGHEIQVRRSVVERD